MSKKQKSQNNEETTEELTTEVQLDEAFLEETVELPHIDGPSLEDLDQLENLDDLSTDLLPLSLDLMDDEIFIDEFSEEEGFDFHDDAHDEDDDEEDQFGSVDGHKKEK